MFRLNSSLNILLTSINIVVEICLFISNFFKNKYPCKGFSSVVWLIDGYVYFGLIIITSVYMEDYLSLYAIYIDTIFSNNSTF